MSFNNYNSINCKINLNCCIDENQILLFFLNIIIYLMKFLTNKKYLLKVLVIWLIYSIIESKKAVRQNDDVEVPEIGGAIIKKAPEELPKLPPLEGPKDPDEKDDSSDPTKPKIQKISPGVLVLADPQLKTLYDVNHLLNRGYSLLADQSSLLERPASVLGKYNIFEYEFDLEKALNMHTSPSDLIFDAQPKNDKGQKILKEYSAEEIMQAQDFAISGNYKVSNSNFLYQRGRSVKGLSKKKTVLYFHEKVEFSVTVNNKTDFPRLNPVFLADALEIFNRPLVSEFEGQEDYVRDGIAFLHKYGTHYMRKSKWGSRMTMLTELKLHKEDMVPSNKTAKSDSNVQSGSVSLEGSKDKPGERFVDFDNSMELGNCKVDTIKNEFYDCQKKQQNFGLIGYDVDYLYNLFNTASITGTLKLPDKSVVSPDKIELIQKNLKALIDGIEAALDVRNSIISDVAIFNNMLVEEKSSLICLNEAKTKRFGLIGNSLFGDEYKVEKLKPLFKLNAKNHINYFDHGLISKKKYTTYACLTKRFNLLREDFFSSQLFNREYINGLIFSNNSTLKSDNIKPEDCTNLWVGKGGDSTDPKKFLVNYLCMKKTANFLDPNIITDIKVKSFDGNKCSSFKYNDREYFCLCDTDLGKFAKKKMKAKRYLCYSTKSINA